MEMEKKDRKYIDIKAMLEMRDRNHDDIKALLEMEEKLIAHIDKVQGIQMEINNDIYSRLSSIMDKLSDIYKI
jgi:hypothetical protein